MIHPLDRRSCWARRQTLGNKHDLSNFSRPLHRLSGIDPSSTRVKDAMSETGGLRVIPLLLSPPDHLSSQTTSFRQRKKKREQYHDRVDSVGERDV